MTSLPEAFRRVPLAHRGLHDVTGGRPENSRAGITAAIAWGYGIEIDLQLSRDGRAMVFHDYDLGRLTGDTGPVRQRDAAALADLPLLGGKEGIPDLSEVLTLVDGRVPLLIELKDQHGQMGNTDGALENATAEALTQYTGPVAVMSFNPHMVARMAILAPDIPRGLVTCGYTPDDWPLLRPETRNRLRDIPDFRATGADFVSHDIKDLDRPILRHLRADGAAILCWTVRSPEAEARARVHAHNITFEGYRPAIPA
ncbi:glycerophosphodiester phosphodiesterase family protein [uncultured Roseovarius sp.]|uniref:glycerophosphodiester phosphodiesterase family protein n=1 Tax=uncultured Roseovarius sp. TaxID=293344 RepID=UPI0026058F0E|nr:glycerophosphodiester phosphodiesterase family protein [uncultured Roseovarius sp.]